MTKKFIILTIGICMVLFAGYVTADPLIPAHNETMGLQIGTVASVDGQLKEDNEVALETTNGVLDGILSPPGPLIGEFDGIYWIIKDNPVFDIYPGVSPGEIQYSTVYREDTAGNMGHTGYSNQFSLSNANKLPGESNIEAIRAIVFTTDNSGSLSSSERLTLDGAGQFDFAKGRLICPFGAGESEFVPAFCSQVESGSDLLISSGSLATNAKERFIAQSSDNPLTMDYLVQLNGLDGPATGSISAYMAGSTKEGAVDVLYEIPFSVEIPELGTNYFVKSDLVSEMEFNDQTGISGSITLFEKIMHYESGVSF
jgi:hypothetical protein